MVLPVGSGVYTVLNDLALSCKAIIIRCLGIVVTRLL